MANYEELKDYLNRFSSVKDYSFVEVVDGLVDINVTVSCSLTATVLEVLPECGFTLIGIIPRDAFHLSLTCTYKS